MRETWQHVKAELDAAPCGADPIEEAVALRLVLSIKDALRQPKYANAGIDGASAESTLFDAANPRGIEHHAILKTIATAGANAHIIR